MMKLLKAVLTDGTLLLGVAVIVVSLCPAPPWAWWPAGALA